MTEYCSALAAADFHPGTRAFFAERHVLVLGGSGFIGSHVVEALLALQARPVVLSRSASPDFLRHLGDRVMLRQGRLERAEDAAAAMQGVSVVLNLAASVAGIAWNAAHPASMFMDNIEIFSGALRAAAAAKVERFLVTSSACVYPRFCTIPTPEQEGCRDEPEPTNAGYGWAKRMEEFLARAAMQEFGMSIAVARPYNAYGPRDDFAAGTSHVIPALIRKAVESADGSFPVWGDGSHSRGFLYVDDFARGLLEVAARYPQADPVNIGAAEETTIRTVAERIAFHVGQRLGSPRHPVFNPQGLTGQPRRACDTRKARAVLDYEARVPFDQGLRRTIDWYIDTCASRSAS